QARSPKTRDAMVKSYRQLMATTRAVLRDTATMVRRRGQRARTARPHLRPILQRAHDGLSVMRPVVQRVVDQTRARVLGGDTHVPDKVLSLFERHTVTIRKGKIAKPNEFGNLVTIQEAEHQIVTAFAIHPSGRRTSRCGRPRWIGIRRSSDARRIWPRATAVSARPGTNRRRLTAACDTWSCRGEGP